jgi:hypothetical protein
MEFGATAIIFIVTVAFAVAGARATLWTVLFFLTRPKVQYEPVDGDRPRVAGRTPPDCEVNHVHYDAPVLG